MSFWEVRGDIFEDLGGHFRGLGGFGGHVGGILAQRVIFGGFLHPGDPPNGAMLGPNSSHVGAKLEYFRNGVAVVGVLERGFNLKGSWHRFLKDFGQKSNPNRPTLDSGESRW